MSPIFLAGPCVIENDELLDVVAQRLVEIREKLQVEVYFKASLIKQTGPRSGPSEVLV